MTTSPASTTYDTKHPWKPMFEYSKVCYRCICKDQRHFRICYFDEAPPPSCPAGARMLIDSTYEDERGRERRLAAVKTDVMAKGER